MTRLTRAWGALEHEQRLAAAAALGMFITMFLPWYQQNAVVSTARTQPLVSRNLDAFAVFSFVEAAVLLVSLAVLFLLFSRAEQRSFHLPGSDGTVVFLAGIWTALLLTWRLFDKPGITSHGIAANVGIQWGIFFALSAAGLLAYAGSRMRAARPPEPPLLRTRPTRRRRYPDEEVTTLAPAPAHPKRSTPVPARGRPPYPPAPPEQLSLEDSPADRD